MREFQKRFILLLALGISSCTPSAKDGEMIPVPTGTSAPRATANLKECLPDTSIRYLPGSFFGEYTGRVFAISDTRGVRLISGDQTAAFIIPAPERYIDSGIGVSVQLGNDLGIEDGFVSTFSCSPSKITAALRSQGNNSIIWANTKTGFWDILEGRELAEKLTKRISIFEVKWERPAVQISLPMRIAK